MKLIVTKSGFEATTETNPSNMIISSDYSTLKYFTFGEDSTNEYGRIEVEHDLDYIPYVEVYVAIGVGSPSNTYMYCPFTGSGATIAFGASYEITETKLYLYALMSGMPVDTWYFDFKYFIFRNELDFD